MSSFRSRPDRIDRRKVHGTQAEIRLYDSYAHPSYEKRIEIEHGSDEWIFGIDDDDTASVMSPDVGGVEVPEWIERSFRSLGVEVDDT